MIMGGKKRFAAYALGNIFRNGGGTEELEDHDRDRVEQTPVTAVSPLARTGDPTLPASGLAALGLTFTLLSMRRRHRRATRCRAHAELARKR